MSREEYFYRTTPAVARGLGLCGHLWWIDLFRRKGYWGPIVNRIPTGTDRLVVNWTDIIQLIISYLSKTTEKHHKMITIKHCVVIDNFVFGLKIFNRKNNSLMANILWHVLFHILIHCLTQFQLDNEYQNHQAIFSNGSFCNLQVRMFCVCISCPVMTPLHQRHLMFSGGIEIFIKPRIINVLF